MSYRLNSLKGFLLRLTEGDISGLFYGSIVCPGSLIDVERGLVQWRVELEQAKAQRCQGSVLQGLEFVEAGCRKRLRDLDYGGLGFRV